MTKQMVEKRAWLRRRQDEHGATSWVVRRSGARRRSCFWHVGPYRDREKARMCDVGDDEEDEAKAYLRGGTFNDPVFDACWASSPFFRGAPEEQLPVKLG